MSTETESTIKFHNLTLKVINSTSPENLVNITYAFQMLVRLIETRSANLLWVFDCCKFFLSKEVTNEYVFDASRYSGQTLYDIIANAIDVNARMSKRDKGCDFRNPTCMLELFCQDPDILRRLLNGTKMDILMYTTFLAHMPNRAMATKLLLECLQE